MNKKFGILFIFALLVGTVFLTACQQDAVGQKRGGDIIKNGGTKVLTDSGEISCYCGTDADGKAVYCTGSGDGTVSNCSCCSNAAL